MKRRLGVTLPAPEAPRWEHNYIAFHNCTYFDAKCGVPLDVCEFRS
jgi:hypothetical protein